MHSHLKAPSVPRSPSRRIEGSVWAISMVRNEENTIAHTVQHLARQGIDAFLIADNGSTDGTADVLRSLAKEHCVHVLTDSLQDYLQGTKMTILAELARRQGADWIVPFDADELWFAGEGTVADFLRSSACPIVEATLHNVFPSRDDDLQESNPFRRLRSLDSYPSSLGKVAFRTHRFMRIATGNHGVSRPGCSSAGLYIAHFPWQSFDQLRSKLENGKLALQSIADEELGAHWRRGGSLDSNGMEALWNALCDGQPVETLAWSPVGPMVQARVDEWTSFML